MNIMNKVLYSIVAVIALLIGLFFYSLASQKNLPQPDNALFYPESRTIQPFEMLDNKGQVFNNASLLGKWSWVFFGYTSCPDVCPTTLQTLNFAYNDLQAIAPLNQVILVTVDPLRDSEETLSQYINYFHQDFIALRAGHEVLFPFARNLGLMYAITNEADSTVQSGSYLVDHSASIILVNPQGNIAAIIKPTHILGQIPSIDKDTLVDDFEKIVNLSHTNSQ